MTSLAGLPHPEDGHAGDNRVGVVLGGRVDGVVGADDEHEVSILHVVVDFFHFEYNVIRDAGLGQEDVQLAGHAAGHGMDAETEQGKILNT